MILAMEQIPTKTDKEIPVYVPNKELNKQGLTQEDLAILGVGGASMSILILFGGKIATTALLVSLVTTGSGAILWIKMPATIRKVPVLGKLIQMLPISDKHKESILNLNWKDKVDKYELLVDLLISAGVVVIFGTTVTGLLAAGMTGLMISSIFRVRKVVRRISFQMKEGVKEALL